MVGQGSEWRELCCAVLHRHLRMALGDVVRKVDDVVVVAHSVLCLVSSYLAVAVFGRCPFLEVQTAQDGVFAVPLLNG